MPISFLHSLAQAHPQARLVMESLYANAASAAGAAVVLTIAIALCAKKKGGSPRQHRAAPGGSHRTPVSPSEAAYKVGNEKVGNTAVAYEETLPPIPSGNHASEPTVRSPVASSRSPAPPSRAASTTGTGTEGSAHESNYAQVHINDNIDRLKRNRKDIEIIRGAKLGEGVSGEVHRATLQGTGTVAVKMLTDHSEINVKEFLEEATLMASFDHRNVVKILGVCIGEEPHMLVMEFLSKGDLIHFLHDKRDLNTSIEDVGMETLIGIGADVAKGMAHLEEIGCVHRDLAARNVLLSEDLTAKLTDFGLSRHTSSEYYEQATARQLPVRWMAYETLTVGKSSIRSDVWSFGVLLWEIMTLGETPYTDLQGGREIVAFLDQEKRLEKPAGCPDLFYEIMNECWFADPRSRPKFTALDQQLAGMKDLFLKTGSVEAPRPVPPPRPDTPYWMQGTLSREEAEEILDEWGGGIGTFLIRESIAAFVISRVGRSDAATDSQNQNQSVSMIIHRKIDFKAGMYQMQSTRTVAPAFKTLVIYTFCALLPTCPSSSSFSSSSSSSTF